MSNLKKFNLSLFVVFLALHTPALFPEAETVTAQKSMLEKIADINMKSFGWENDDWDAHSMYEFLTEHIKRRLNPIPKERRRRAFEFYKATDKNSQTPGSVLFNDVTTWGDLTLFCGQADQSKYVAKVLSRTKTELGTLALYQLLANPVADLTTLMKRQAIIKSFLEAQNIFEDSDSLLKELTIPENIFLSFYNQDHLKDGVKRHCTFQVQAGLPLNEQEDLLLLRNIYGHQERLLGVLGNAFAAFVLTTYGLLNLTQVIDTPAQIQAWAHDYKGSAGPVFPWLWKINNRYVHSLIAIAGGAFCGASVKESAEWTRDCFFLDECVYKIILNLGVFITSSKKIYNLICQDPRLRSCDEFKGIIDFYEKQLPASPKLQEFLEMLESETFKDECSIISHKGRIIRSFILMHEIKKDLESLALGLGVFDAYLSLAKLVREHELQPVQFCFPTYVTADKPMVDIKNFWHPLINVDVVVPNSLALGCHGKRSGMIITGPNAGGKSTVLKALTLSIVLAQTVGIVPAQSMTVTPFRSIATYLNIVDDISAGNSLFMAEVKQAQALIDKVESSRHDEFSFTCFDEVFNGTSPKEGTAAAYAVAYYLSQFPSNMCVISTHFPLLTELEKDTQTFMNYRVTVDSLRNSQISYPYKLESGVSDQHVALDILKEQGFNGSLLEVAQNMVQRIQI